MMHGVENKSLGRAWLTCLSAALFFFYEFIQMNIFNAISIPLMHAFSINATQLGRMSSFYFIANVIFLFPAGMLLDRYSARGVILVSLAICVAGTVCFAFAPSVGWATLFRFLTGIGSAFCFLSCIRLATRWFPSFNMALVTGVIVTIAMAGGMLAQTPFTLLVQAVDWHNALLMDAGLGLAVFAWIALMVYDFPDHHATQYADERQQVQVMGYWKSMGLAFLRLQNWLGGIYTCLMNLTLVLLGGLWGTLYAVNVHGVSELDASYVTSMLFLGTIIGSPMVGAISDRVGLRRLPMMMGAVVSFALIMIVVLAQHLSLMELMWLFLSLGVSTSTQIIGYPTVAESSLPAITAMSVSVVNITCQGGIAIFQPMFGYLMDWHARIAHNLPGHYVAGDFHWAMLIFPVAFLIAFLAAFCLQETYCRPKSGHFDENTPM